MTKEKQRKVNERDILLDLKTIIIRLEFWFDILQFIYEYAEVNEKQVTPQTLLEITTQWGHLI
ncbi:hypothetical protein H1Z61_13075 [Bacillus aquiflavi]|uniref:Uncharacterized protein n=1 Tax=Bacillus aquiflavi TaxID=2672567 RepID=A0A6B3W309_9BACI|nr:hypothetical protein [Bacillus aquiflavi]MBA4538040.1 hypothetical protein [Bacillus aquiflavi]NEY82296.1 hypothetical protein [Bacillus aquiflavi]UAC48798.1 hypothetical protein K6959_02215 [Bacillus aquiflavi]